VPIEIQQRVLWKWGGEMTHKLHILLVEDDPFVAETLQTTLETEYRVSCAYSVAEARAFLTTAHLDAVLMDAILPDGRSDEIANFAEAIGTPVVEMTGYPIEFVGTEKCQRPRLHKPFGAMVLFSTIKGVLE
jgi:DNA-binding response OmpR family regulator